MKLAFGHKPMIVRGTDSFYLKTLGRSYFIQHVQVKTPR